MLPGYSPLRLCLHPDDELALVPPGCQGPEGQLRLVQAEDPLAHRVNLAIRDKFSEIVQNVSIQPGIFPVLAKIKN